MLFDRELAARLLAGRSSGCGAFSGHSLLGYVVSRKWNRARERREHRSGRGREAKKRTQRKLTMLMLTL